MVTVNFSQKYRLNKFSCLHGITDVELKNEQSLREYFGSAYESGGGEIEMLEFDGCNKVSISFKDPSGE